MRAPQLGTRPRILIACLVLSLLAVLALGAFGFAFRRVLHGRSRESCIRIATMYEETAHGRLVHLAVLADHLSRVLARPGAGDLGEGLRLLPTLGGVTGVCSLAVYDAGGQRLAGRRAERSWQVLDRAGIGTPQIPARELPRVGGALAGEATTVLVPHGDQVYALLYQPIRREGHPPLALQLALKLVGSVVPPATAGDGARAILRPFVSTADEPHVVRIGGRPRMIVHRPLSFGGRTLGTIAAAVPYDEEVRCAQGATLITIVVVVGSLAVLIVISDLLTDMAMAPLASVGRFVANQQSGRAIERPEQIPNDETGTLLVAYQDMLDRSQAWADEILESNRALRDLLCGAVEALVGTIEAKDGYTAGHSKRVADAACAVARELGWERQAIEELRLGALLHDVGKIGISGDILNKPGALTDEEMETVRQHPLIGGRILSPLPGCESIVRMILAHHERHDGAGYPAGLSGEQIPVAARIVAVADVYDALTSHRSYRPAHSREEAVEILKAGRGTMHDPRILDTFLPIVHRCGGPAAGPGRGVAVEPPGSRRPTHAAEPTAPGGST